MYKPNFKPFVTVNVILMTQFGDILNMLPSKLLKLIRIGFIKLLSIVLKVKE